MSNTDSVVIFNNGPGPFKWSDTFMKEYYLMYGEVIEDFLESDIYTRTDNIEVLQCINRIGLDKCGDGCNIALAFMPRELAMNGIEILCNNGVEEIHVDENKYIVDKLYGLKTLVAPRIAIKRLLTRLSFYKKLIRFVYS